MKLTISSFWTGFQETQPKVVYSRALNHRHKTSCTFKAIHIPFLPPKCRKHVVPQFDKTVLHELYVFFFSDISIAKEFSTFTL